MKKLPDSLLEKQAQRRANTADVVEKAIVELEAQGYSIRIKDLISITGLSRSVFAKPHVRKILVEYGISQPSHLDTPTCKTDAPRNIDMIIAEKDGYIHRLLTENDRLKYEIELLRGKIHLLMHRSAQEDDLRF